MRFVDSEQEAIRRENLRAYREAEERAARVVSILIGAAFLFVLTAVVGVSCV